MVANRGKGRTFLFRMYPTWGRLGCLHYCNNVEIEEDVDTFARALISTSQKFQADNIVGLGDSPTKTIVLVLPTTFENCIHFLKEMISKFKS